MLADPSHTRKFSNDDAIANRRTVPSARGSIGSLKEPMSRLCGVLKTFVKIGVGIGRTGTEGRFLRKGHENGPCINDSEKPSNTEESCARNGYRGRGRNQPTCRRVRRSYCGLVHHLFFYFFAGHVGGSGFDFGSTRIYER